MKVIYYEEEAKLQVIADSKSYYYRDVPYSIYRKIMIWNQRGYYGRIWNTIKLYKESK
jgi:hypothetical protein